MRRSPVAWHVPSAAGGFPSDQELKSVPRCCHGRDARGVCPQNALAFDMGPYLFGHKGPAQCIHFTQQPMKVHVVPRAGGTPKVGAAVVLMDDHPLGFHLVRLCNPLKPFKAHCNPCAQPSRCSMSLRARARFPMRRLT